MRSKTGSSDERRSINGLIEVKRAMIAARKKKRQARIDRAVKSSRCLFGDCRESMRSLIAEGTQVQTCVTSPPYWGLRDYGHAGQLGLEATPEEYVAGMVEVFGLVRELLVDDGTLWLNLGDSYTATHHGKQGATHSDAFHATGQAYIDNVTGTRRKKSGIPDGLKPKDLVGIPWRVAFALQADGWYLRQDIIWAKPNPMPESVQDRCTKAHEYLFLLSKSPRYYFDAAAIAEPVTDKETLSGKRPRNADHITSDAGYDGHRTRVSLMAAEMPRESRNRRSVWTIASAPYSGAHFATFPPKLIEPCILAGSRLGDVVLDPFFGSGTTGQVASANGRGWLGCEINEAYKALQIDRVAKPYTRGKR